MKITSLLRSHEMAQAGYSCFTPDFKLIKKDLLYTKVEGVGAALGARSSGTSPCPGYLSAEQILSAALDVAAQADHSPE